MKQVKINKQFRDPITVEWIDACEQTGWKSFEDAIRVPDEVYVTTRGFYLKHTKDFLTMAASVGKGKDNEVGGVWHIPRAWIQKIRP